MENIYQITDTYELIGIVEQIKPAATYLTDLFFPNKIQSLSDIAAVEYRKEDRRLAPYVTRGRERSKVQFYKSPLIGAKRVIGLEDVQRRVFGETPIYSKQTPQERAAQIQAEDLRQLLNMLSNRREQMAAELLQTGKVTIKGYADDGKLAETDVIEFETYEVVEPTIKWDQSGAKIFSDLKGVCDRIAQDSNLLPTVMICGANVENYLMSNAEIKNWLQVPNRANLAMMSFEPRYTSPQTRYIGQISSLGLEVVSYAATYKADDGTTKPFIAADTCIVGVPGNGKFLYGAVNYLDSSGSWQSAAAENVPVYSFDFNSQSTSLSVLSRCLPIPDVATDFMTLKVVA